MVINIKKSFNTLVFRAIAVLISFCYLLSPLHKEMGVFLHEITHLLQEPNLEVSHSHDRYDGDSGKHHEHALTNSEHNHSHHFLDFFNDIFKDIENRKNSKDSNTLVLKIDKHIQHKEQYKRPFGFVFYKQNKTTFFITKQTHLGYLNNLLRPPQFF